jgi:uncharacterized protein
VPALSVPRARPDRKRILTSVYIDWRRVVGFDWDAGNERKSVDKHRVRQTEAEQAFFNQPLLVLEDERDSADELRFHALY